VSPHDAEATEERSIITQRDARSDFRAFHLGRDLERGIEGAGFTTPRPIQTQTVPAVLEGKDVLGLAQTGTGKTAAFVLPILARLLRNPTKAAGPRALIVAPTRELASQIHAELELLARFTPVRATTVFGGVSAVAQIKELRRRPDVVIGCPGRLLDLHERRELRLDHIEVLVLDEADHMFDMGFLPSIRRLLAALPKRRQNLLFSATMPQEIRQLTDRLLDRPLVVELAHSRPAETIEHALYPVAEDRKVALLDTLLEGDDFRSAIVFLRTKRRAKRLAERLSKMGHNAIALQGNMSQPQRERAMSGFRDGRYEVLVATDIAARGIDVAGVSHVINFDVPNTPDAYTHRIGRTGRAEKSGRACTFVTSADHAAIKAIERKLGAPIPRRGADAPAPAPAHARASGGNATASPARREKEGSRSRRKTARPLALVTSGVGRSAPESASAPSSFGQGVFDGARTTAAGEGARRRRARTSRRHAASRR
jgi:ATP-dependent RNA helicase RhlE